MARPIKETPVLTGTDADRFIERMENVHRASQEELNQAKEAYEFFKSISTFPM